ncbi:MAG: nitroreductase [Paracoccaceae bacterium]
MNDKQILDNILERRYSCRSFLQTPVEQQIIEEILRISQKIPSWCNAQPWEVIICGGSAIKTLSKNLLLENSKNQYHSDIPFPLEYKGIYRERRKECGLQLYESVGIKKGETEKAFLQMNENFKFFGAPHVAIITSEKSLGTYGAIDCGAFVSTFTLTAASMKISTIPQAAIASLSNVVRETLNISNEKDIICAISFGYENAEHPVNKFRTSRAKLSEVVNWIDSID